MRDIDECICGSNSFEMELKGRVEVYTCTKCGEITSYHTKWKMWADGEEWDNEQEEKCSECGNCYLSKIDG